MRTQFWLATLDQYENPTLRDGPHAVRAGADRALYLLKRLGLFDPSKQYVIAKITLTEAIGEAVPVNEDAIAACNTMRRHVKRKR